MKKNGFTFIEILGVITLLALFSVIIIVVIDKNLKDSKEVLSSVQIENIKSAASMWRTDNIKLVPDSGYYYISLSELQSKGYIQDDVIDPKTNEIFSDDLVIKVSLNDVIVDDVLIANDYKKLEYIESTGTQYIDTGVIANQNTGFDIDFIAFNKIAAGSSKGSGTIFGARENYKTNGYHLTTYNNRSLMGHFLFGTNQSEHSIRYSAGIIPGVRQQISFRNRVLTLPDNTTTTVTNYDFQTPSTLTLFVLHERTYFSEKSNTRLYSFKLYDGNSLIRDYIPCLRKSDKKPGLYDLVENKFYENAGEGEFVYKLPKERPYERLYTKLDYIQSSGEQYIDTGYVPHFGDLYNITFQPLYLNLNQVFFGSRTSGEWATSMDQVYLNQSAASGSENKLLFFAGTVNVNPVTLSLDQTYNYRFEISSGNFDGNNSNNLYIFALNNKGSVGAYSNIKLYNFEIYNNGSLVRNFVPAKRNRDNKVGLYDEVNDVFYVSDGSSDFLSS